MTDRVLSFTRTVASRPGAVRYVVALDGRPVGSVENRPAYGHDNWTATADAVHVLDIAYSTRDEAVDALLTKLSEQTDRI